MMMLCDQVGLCYPEVIYRIARRGTSGFTFHHRFMSSHPHHLPSPAEHTAVHELIAQEEKRLRRLNSRTNYVRTRKKAVEQEQERAQIESVIAKHKSFLAPVRALPPEVLALIFDHYGNHQAVASTLSRVCKTWHQTACTFARYWTLICLIFPRDPRRSQIPYILSRIERSRQLPLIFAIDGRLQEKRPTLTRSVRREIKRCMEALIGENGRNLLRCSHLLLDLDENFSNSEGLAWFNYPMPSLSWASIMFDSDHQRNALEFLGNAPNLTALTVDVGGVLDIPKTDFPHLDTLTLYYHTSLSMSSYLIICRNLTLLHLSDYTCSSIIPPYGVVPAFAMTSLQSLVLEGIILHDLLRCVSFPNLRTLTFAGNRWNHDSLDENEQILLSDVIDCLLPSLSGVESVLLFRRPLDAHNADALLRALTSLRLLGICGEMPEVDHVLEDPEVCPKLFFTYRLTDADSTHPRLEPVSNRSIPKEGLAEVSRSFCQKRGKGVDLVTGIRLGEELHLSGIVSYWTTLERYR